MKSIIKSVRNKSYGDDRHIAAITGVREIPKPTYFENMETGDEYYALVGALAFPGHSAPGFAVIIAALKGQRRLEDPQLKVVDEIESTSGIESLLQACKDRRERWGYPNTLYYFYGDQERFSSAICSFNERVSRSDDGLYLASPSDFHLPNRTEVYLERIKSLLRKGSSGEKQLSLESCPKLIAHMENLPSDAHRHPIETYPAIAALGYGVHSMLSLQPWMGFALPERLVPTVRDYEDYAVGRQVEAIDSLLSGGGVGFYGDDELISTIL